MRLWYKVAVDVPTVGAALTEVPELRNGYEPIVEDGRVIGTVTFDWGFDTPEAEREKTKEEFNLEILEVYTERPKIFSPDGCDTHQHSR